MTDREIVALFADGGLIKGSKNPSPIGGTWAWCGVTREGEHVREVSAYLLPRSATCPGNPRVGSDTVSNNDCEFYATLRAIEAMKDGWSGSLVTDSQVTIERLKKCRDGHMPTAFRTDWFSRAHCAFRRLGKVSIVHVVGHPTQKELADGFRANQDGSQSRVSRHQDWCDKECTRRAETYGEHMQGWVDTGLLQPELLNAKVA